MSLFKRSVVAEITSHVGVVFSTLIVVWLSVLLVRLLGQAAEGSIGADIVFGIAALSSITALPTILSVSLFIAVLSTISRNYRESEMVVWFASGVSLLDWIRPVLRVAIPVCVLIAVLTLQASPWAYRQIEEYRQRFEQRSDIAKIAFGQFIESDQGKRVFFIEAPSNPEDEMGKVFARVYDDYWYSTITSDNAKLRQEENGDRFLVLGPGNRYDMKPGSAEFRMIKFDNYTMRLESKGGASTEENIRNVALNVMKARPTGNLFEDQTSKSDSQIMWRISLPLAALNLALLAIPLGAVNPRLGRSGDLVLAGLIGLLYMNTMNLVRGWISSDKIDMIGGMVLLHGAVLLLCVFLFRKRLTLKKPKTQKV